MSTTAPVYVLGPDDLVEIKEYGISQFDSKVRLDEDGSVQLPLVGKVMLGGLRVSDAQSKINRLLIDSGMILSPNTILQVVERPGQQVTVSGAVLKPGLFPAEGRHTLSDYLSLAGELKDAASATVVLTRPGLPHPVAIALGPNPTGSSFRQIPIFAGDEIHASAVGVFYIVGALKTQGAYPLKNSTPTTVMEAVTMAGGVGYEASYSSTKIVRTSSDGQRTLLSVNLQRVMTGKDQDVILKSDDIVYVPTSLGKAAIKGGATSLIVSLASSYLYVYGAR